ncbi:MAG TPA: thioredoxin [Gammaproteobacteria bacterium]|nr:thioredoxin [Gammaproteobacteria bacterium]
MNEHSHIVEVGASDFEQAVIAESHQRPVLVDFWADWCSPCQMLMPVLAKLAQDYAGGFLLAKVDTEREQALAVREGIRSLPTLRLYRNGEVVDEVMGAQPETVLRELLDRWVERASDRALQQAQELLARGETEAGLRQLEQAWREDPDNPRLPFVLVRELILAGHRERARDVLEQLPATLRNDPQADTLRKLLDFAAVLEDAPERAELERRLKQQADDREALCQLGARQLLEGAPEAALDSFMRLLQKDPEYGEGVARRGLLTAFALLGDEHPKVAEYRRRMFALLH